MATPPTSYGYPGSINAAALATWLPAAAAARFSVVGTDDWKVSVQGGLDRGIRINAGTGSGDGIMDITAEYETMALPMVASGSQWFMVVRRRNWATPATTVPVVIPGTSEKKLPARSNTPGQESDQPLALCRVQAEQTVVQEIIDLRCWAGNGGVIAADVLALEYLARPGADVLIGSSSWRYALGANGVWEWVDEDADGPWASLTLGPGWVNGPGFTSRARSIRRGKFVQLSIDCSYSGAGTPAVDWVLAILPPNLKPSTPTLTVGATDGYTRLGMYWVGPNGVQVGAGNSGKYVQLSTTVPLI